MDFSKEITFGKKKKDAADAPSDPPVSEGGSPQTAPVGAGGSAGQGVPKKIGKAGSGKRDAFPSKKNINLIKGKKQRFSAVTQILMFAVVVVIIAIFAKVAVIDPLASASESSRKVSEAQAQLDALTASNNANAGLSEDYAKYAIPNMTSEEASLVDRNEIIDLLQTRVAGFGYMSSLKVTDNVVEVTCSNVSLADVSGLVQSLESDPRVSYVTVSTAQNAEKTGTSATVSITMNNSAQEGANNG